ncbi:lung seven transmembrane receptor-domain-containing protein [Obelidium mucronatum]|nr:lung seven transmembrane receptor-domain-containing protein [Obelidium mucronatum]
MFYHDILQLQHYISAVTFFLMVEMAFNYGYYEEYNMAGEPHSFLLVMVVVLNAARNSISFFMLLIVSLGYGVVKPSLGTNMKKCVILGVFHFICGVLYGAGSLVVNEVSAGLALFFSLPLSFAMTAFYYAILNSLTLTMQTLQERRQPIKLLMYNRLWGILVFSAVVLLAFFIVNTIAFKNRFEPSWMETYWQIRWLLLDGWLNILYLVVYLSIALLWRPTENNQRYGLEQLASDDYDDDEEVVQGGSHNVTQTKHRKVQLRAMHTAHTDETLEDGFEGDFDEDEDDVFRWAEENVGGEIPAATTGAGVGTGGPSMVRDSSSAGLLEQEEQDGRPRNHKMA